MVRLREIPRTAAFAWSPGSELPLVVTGTRAGAVDADFSDETKLELWDLSLDNLEQGIELQPIASINTDSRFHDIAWGPANAEHPRGIIAGALENGSLDLWDAEKLIKGDSDAFISRTTKHTGAIKSLQFNPLKPQILATAGTKGELYIYDVNDVSNPFRLGTAAARSDDLECVAWNRKVPHILATGGNGGLVTVWDLKTKKASLTLNNNRKAVGAIAWDPNNATKLLTATPDDSTPVILLWDLRNSQAPERTLQGHDQGILSLSWCQQDSDLLLSCGKDNKTICWNPQTGERLGEFPEVTNWTFQTRFNPHNPALSATASFDGKIAIQTLQNTNPTTSQAISQGPSDGEDFFTKAQTQPQGASFSLRRAPKWMERPVGASFGFGGNLVSFMLQDAAAGHPKTSKIQITKFSADSDIETATESFETALQLGDIRSICETHISKAKTDDEKADWQVIETLIADNPRKGVTEYLGFSEVEEATNGVAGGEAKVEDGDANVADEAESTASKDKNRRLSTFFSDGPENDDFASSLASTKGAKIDNPFELFAKSDSQSDKQITKALMLGQFEKATGICLKEDRMADAFMIANCGGKELVDKVQAAYLSTSSKGPNYLRLLASVIGKNLWDIVYNADLANWKESMATLCTYADPNEFPDLCEALGDRILESGARKDASFCFLVGSKLEKVIGIWIEELKELEEAGIQDASGDSAFSVHAHSLQNFIEKVTVFRDVTKFDDKERAITSGWKLSPLYDRYVEYADIIAAHGQLTTAQKYLELVPTEYPAAEAARGRVRLASRKAAPQAQSRVQQRTQQQPSANLNGARTQQATAFQPVNAFQPLNTFQPLQPASILPTPAVSQPYAPPTPAAAASNPYAPPAQTPTNNAYAPPSSTNSYVPQAGYIPQQQQQAPYGMPTPAAYGTPQPPPLSFGGPPRNTSAGPAVVPPSRAKDMVNWNDTPMVTKLTPSRRPTPSQPPITSPFPNHGNLSIAPPAPPFGGARGTSTPPPPPKGSAPPRITSPLTGPPTNSFPPPIRTSSTANIYAPPPPQVGQQGGQQPGQQYGQPQPPPTVPRGASPYNPPPSGAPPTSRYAPAPSQQYSQPPAPQAQAPPQMASRPPPPSNSFAPQQQSRPPQGQFGQKEYQQTPPPSQGPPQGLPQGPPQGPPRGPPQGAQSGDRPETPNSHAPKPSTPAPSKYPAGDRSHIPAAAQQMVEIFNSDMQRVATIAPPSFAAQVKDTQKRLNILFDHLNNEELLTGETIDKLSRLASALSAKDFDGASRLQVDIQREHKEECGNWMIGVKRLISMSKVTP